MQGLGCTGLEYASPESHQSTESNNYCKHLGGVRLSLAEIIESTSKAGAKNIHMNLVDMRRLGDATAAGGESGKNEEEGGAGSALDLLVKFVPHHHPGASSSSGRDAAGGDADAAENPSKDALSEASGTGDNGSDPSNTETDVEVYYKELHRTYPHLVVGDDEAAMAAAAAAETSSVAVKGGKVPVPDMDLEVRCGQISVTFYLEPTLEFMQNASEGDLDASRYGGRERRRGGRRNPLALHTQHTLAVHEHAGKRMLVKMMAVSILSTSATLQFTPRKSLKTKVEFNMGLDQIQARNAAANACGKRPSLALPYQRPINHLTSQIIGFTGLQSNRPMELLSLPSLAVHLTMSPRRAMPWTLVCDVGKVHGELDIHYLGQAIRLGGLCTDLKRIMALGHNHYFLFIVRSVQVRGCFDCLTRRSRTL